MRKYSRFNAIKHVCDVMNDEALLLVFIFSSLMTRELLMIMKLLSIFKPKKKSTYLLYLIFTIKTLNRNEKAKIKHFIIKVKFIIIITKLSNLNKF